MNIDRLQPYLAELIIDSIRTNTRGDNMWRMQARIAKFSSLQNIPDNIAVEYKGASNGQWS